MSSKLQTRPPQDLSSIESPQRSVTPANFVAGNIYKPNLSSRSSAHYTITKILITTKRRSTFYHIIEIVHCPRHSYGMAIYHICLVNEDTSDNFFSFIMDPPETSSTSGIFLSSWVSMLVPSGGNFSVATDVDFFACTLCNPRGKRH